MTGTQFYEEQQFRQKWLWILLLFVTGLVIGIFGYGMITQLLLGNPWGSEPMSDTALATVGSLVILLMLGIDYALFKMKMVTEVGDDTLRIRFAPFVNRRIPMNQIRDCEARTYNSLLEYGGWGIRWRPGKGMAYNTSGNKGVHLRLTNGKSVMIGSQRADELAGAIREYGT